MLINHLMEKLSRETDIVVSLLAKEKIHVEKGEIFSELCLVAVKAQRGYGANGINNEASFETFLSVCIRNWLHDFRFKRKAESVIFYPLESHLEAAEEFDPAVGIIIGEIREQLSERDSRVFDCMLFENMPTRKTICEREDLTEPQVMHARKRIRQITRELLEV